MEIYRYTFQLQRHSTAPFINPHEMLKDLTVYACVCKREKEKERVCTSICSSELLWHQLGGRREDSGHSDLSEQKFNIGLEEQ